MYGHFAVTTRTAGTSSASVPSTSVRFIASSALISASASSSAVPIPMISCMWVGSSFWIASSSRSPVTVGRPRTFPSPFDGAWPFPSPFPAPFPFPFAAAPLAPPYCSSTYSSTALRAMPSANGGTRRIRTSASGDHSRPVSPSSSIHGISSGWTAVVPTRACSPTRCGSGCRPATQVGAVDAMARRGARPRAATARSPPPTGARPGTACRSGSASRSRRRGTPPAITSARLRLAWQSRSSPLSMMLLWSSSCSSNLNTFEAWTDSTSLMLWNTTWWYSTSNALAT